MVGRFFSLSVDGETVTDGILISIDNDVMSVT